MCSDGVQFNVTVAPQYVAFRINQAGFKSSFPESTGSMISGVEILNIPSTQALHHCGNTSKLPTRHEHVNVLVISAYACIWQSCSLAAFCSAER